MNYQRIRNGEVEDIPIRITRAAGVEEVYAHGAAGVNIANYHLRVDFYRDRFPPAEMTIIGNRIPEEDDGNMAVDRTVVASVLMPLPFVKELRNWLTKRIEEIEREQGEIALPKQETESIVPKAKEA